MKRILAIAAVVAIIPAAAPAAKQHYTSTQLCALLEPCLPPPQYASGPFKAQPVIVYLPMQQLQVACDGGEGGVIQAAKEGPDTLGCAQFVGTDCIVRLPLGLKAKLPELYRMVLVHELGHCRGWVHEDY